MLKFLLIVAILYFVIPPLFRLLGVVVAFFLRRAVLKAAAANTNRNVTVKPVATQASLVEDPICKLNLPIDEAIAVQTKHGTVYFCSKECQKSYKNNPTVTSTTTTPIARSL